MDVKPTFKKAAVPKPPKAHDPFAVSRVIRVVCVCTGGARGRGRRVDGLHSRTNHVQPHNQGMGMDVKPTFKKAAVAPAPAPSAHAAPPLAASSSLSAAAAAAGSDDDDGGGFGGDSDLDLSD